MLAAVRGPVNKDSVSKAVWDIASALYPEYPENDFGAIDDYCDVLGSSPAKVADRLEQLLEA